MSSLVFLCLSSHYQSTLLPAQGTVIIATIRDRLKCNDTCKDTKYQSDVWVMNNRSAHNIILGTRFNQINWILKDVSALLCISCTTCDLDAKHTFQYGRRT
jgi:hypothetical protein